MALLVIDRFTTSLRSLPELESQLHPFSAINGGGIALFSPVIIHAVFIAAKAVYKIQPKSSPVRRLLLFQSEGKYVASVKVSCHYAFC